LTGRAAGTSIPATRREAAVAAFDPRIANLEAEVELLTRRLTRAERSRAEAEALLEDKSRVLDNANRALRANREQLRRQLDQRTLQLLEAQRVAGFGTMVWDVERRRGELSAHAQALLGMPGLDEFSSLDIFDRTIHRDDRQPLRDYATQMIRRAIAVRAQPGPRVACPRGHAASESCATCSDRDACDDTVEIRIHPGAGIKRTLRLKAQVNMPAELGRVLVFLTIQDVTAELAAAREAEELRQRDQQRLAELEALTRDLEQARQAAEQANAAKSRFLAMMSHDIRTPMNGVIGMLQLFDDAGLTDDQRHALGHVRASSEQLRILLDDIIDLERAESGKLTLNPQPMHNPAFLHDAIGFWQKVAADKGLELTLERGAFVPGERIVDWIVADRYRLRQLVDNMLSNAIKYTRTGSIRVRLGMLNATRARYEVIDTGIGIPEARRRELFEDFGQLRLDGVGEGGAGLGLAICRRIVELMGGTIGVDANPDGPGSRFWIELPITEIPPPPQSAGPAALVLTMADGRRPRILVAEDVETNRIVARSLLARLGCDVELVNDGEAAVQRAATGGIDLVLMDVSMPVMSGIEATRQIRALPGPAAAVPILALSAYSRPEDLEPILTAGASGQIGKPIRIEELHKMIAKTLQAEQRPDA
jgi:signal transduction histidine kinase/ActR/RegA family two-component response regulator